MCVAAGASEFFYVAHLANIERLIPFQPFILNVKFYVHANSSAWADKKQFKCEKVRFHFEKSEIYSKWVICNL